MSLTDEFYSILDAGDDSTEAKNMAAQLVLAAPVTPESTGLLALMYHDGIGVQPDMDKCFELAEKAALEGHDGLGYIMLGYMCDNAETPDQAQGGPRQKYDHYDAERFYELCAEAGGYWSTAAHLWLGDFFMDMARGGDPEIAIEHYEAIGEKKMDAASKLCDYYWEQKEYEDEHPDGYKFEGLEEKLFKWTRVASDFKPEEYIYRLGWCYMDGIGVGEDEDGAEMARSCWEYAFDLGDWRGASALAFLYEEQLKKLSDSEENEWERLRCEHELELWKKLGDIAREKQWAEEPDCALEED